MDRAWIRGRARDYERAYRRRRPVSGEVVQATGAGVAVELPPALPGFVRRGDLPRPWRMQPSVAIGETIEGLLIASPLEREILLLSPRHLGIMRCEAALNKRRAISVEVANANRGGLLMDVGGLPGFLPRSELRPADAFSHAELVGRTIAAYVIGLSQQQTILSAFPPRARRRRRASRPHRL